ncbi:MAG TPA: malectin [Verrucomicrobiae bacterium]
MLSSLRGLSFLLIIGLVSPLFVGCQSAPQSTINLSASTNGTAMQQPAGAPASSPVTPPAAAPAVSASAPATPAPGQLALPIRIAAGATQSFTDSQGNQWLPDQGFVDGDTTQRPDLSITNTTDPTLYRSEHYSMTSFMEPVPNGKYIAKLHFCETYEGITGPGQRVFSFSLGGHDFNNFDVWVKAGGAQTAYVETVPVEVTDGKFVITFTQSMENPQINGIEIIPASE